MVEIDRLALVIRPTKAFKDWLISITAEESIADDTIDTDPTVILVPVFESDESLSEYIADHCEQWMEYEFSSWCMIEEDWPQERDVETFQEMFDITIHSLVIDNVLEDYAGMENMTLQ